MATNIISGWDQLGEFLRELEPGNAPFELIIQYGTEVTFPSGLGYESVDGSPFWSVWGQFGEFVSDAEGGVADTLDAASENVLFDLSFDLLVATGVLKVVGERADPVAPSNGSDAPVGVSEHASEEVPF